jgi:1-acyl-sn-glycerol-3-phosphate acyltransferase
VLLRTSVIVVQETESRGAGRLQTVVRKALGPVFRQMFDLTIVGIENLPTDGPAIIAANHTSVLDSFIVPSVLPRNISYVGKAEYLDDWKTKHIFPALGMIPIDRSGGDAAQAALDMAVGCSVSIPRAPDPAPAICTRAAPASLVYRTERARRLFLSAWLGCAISSRPMRDCQNSLLRPRSTLARHFILRSTATLLLIPWHTGPWPMP